MLTIRKPTNTTVNKNLPEELQEAVPSLYVILLLKKETELTNSLYYEIV